MPQPNPTDLSATLASAARAARRELERDKATHPAAAAACLALGQIPLPSGLVDALWGLTGLHFALAKTFAAAWERRGRAIVNATFALHALLGYASAETLADPDTPAPLAKPYAALLTKMAGLPACRSAAIQWIDLYNQRLTLHRYSDKSHRARHARLLFSLTLELAQSIARPQEGANRSTQWLDEIAESWLSAWDLLQAHRQAIQGWNRIGDPPQRDWGGFYALSDEARPADDEQIRNAARGHALTRRNQDEENQRDGLCLTETAPAVRAINAGLGAVLTKLAETPQLSAAEAAALINALDKSGKSGGFFAWLRGLPRPPFFG